MRITRLAAVAALAVTAVSGGLGGAALLGPASAGPTPDALPVAAPATATATATDTARCTQGLIDVADTIGITADELRDALRDGQTLAEVAEANGTDPQEVVDVLAANGIERLEAAVAAGRIDQATADERAADLPERAAEIVNGDIERHARRHPRARVGLRTAADAIGITPRELGDALRDGQTIAQVAEANGVDPQAVIDALVARSTEWVTKVVNGDTVWQRC